MGALRRYLRFNATQRGLFGGNQFWFALWIVGTGRRLLRRLGGSAPTVDFSQALVPGETLVVSHPDPAKRSRRSRR